MKILILEDEKWTAEDLKHSILAIKPDAEIIATLGTVEDALAFFNSPPTIDLIFSDIQLGDGLSFELFEQRSIAIPIIFCTAHDEYALRAFRSFGIDYILKPFSSAAIAQALAKYDKLNKFNQAPSEQTYHELFDTIKKKLNPSPAPSILVYRADKIIPIEISKIALFTIHLETVYAVLFDESKFPTQQKMDSLEQKLSPAFYRANRQTLIHRKSIKEVSQHFHRKLQIHLTISFDQPILVGKEKATEFLAWLAG
jgi:two-component system, LytTR family, response regulator LytT